MHFGFVELLNLSFHWGNLEQNQSGARIMNFIKAGCHIAKVVTAMLVEPISSDSST